MLGSIFRKEILSHVLSLRFTISFILFLVLVFASVYVTSSEHKEDIACCAAMTRLAQDHLFDLDQVKQPMERADHLKDEGQMGVIAPAACASIIQGLRPNCPVAVNVTEGQIVNIDRGADRNPLAALFPLPDMMYIVSLVLSLLAVLFAFDAISAEKEQGTLALTLANPVSRATVLLGKWLGGAVALLVPFLVAVAGGLGYAWSQHTLVLDGENTLRLAGMLLVAGCYISVFFTLSLLISTLTHRSSTSLFVCLLVWVLWVLTIPNLAPLLARIVSPVPSSEKINAEKRAVDWETELLVARANRGGGAAYSEAVRQEKERIVQAGEAQKLRWDRFLEEATRRQTSLAQTLGRLSPAACWTYAATALTDTGLGFYESMEHAETTLQKRLNDYSSDLTKEREVTGEWRDFKGQDVPRLQIELPSAAVAFQRAADDIVLLLILNVVLFMAAFVRFIGYDPR